MSTQRFKKGFMRGGCFWAGPGNAEDFYRLGWGHLPDSRNSMQKSEEGKNFGHVQETGRSSEQHLREQVIMGLER